MVYQHNPNMNQSHYQGLDWFNWICRENHKYFSPTAEPSQLAELSHSEFDPELFSHTAYVNFFVTFETKVPYLTLCEKMRLFLI